MWIVHVLDFDSNLYVLQQSTRDNLIEIISGLDE